jgi:hypothetical protein
VLLNTVNKKVDQDIKFCILEYSSVRNQEGFKENVQNTVNKKLDQDIKFCILEYLQSGIKRALRKMCR